MENGYRVRGLTRADAEAIATWRYPAPYDIYDSAPADASRELLAATAAYYADPIHAYFAVDDEMGNFLGFGCFGVEAQVPGYNYAQEDALDIGFGMRPDATGGGRGQSFLAAILDYGLALHRPPLLRATVATFNERSGRTLRRAGFLPAATFLSQHRSPLEFTVYTRQP